MTVFPISGKSESREKRSLGKPESRENQTLLITENAEGRIDSLPQTWAAISGAGDWDHVEVALRSLEENLVREADNLILLLTPPFDKTTADIGYIKGYPPGVRENGGQYTHAATWVALAFAGRGDGDKAVRLLRMLNPVERARD